jgi:hypothetical protein
MSLHQTQTDGATQIEAAPRFGTVSPSSSPVISARGQFAVHLSAEDQHHFDGIAIQVAR